MDRLLSDEDWLYVCTIQTFLIVTNVNRSSVNAKQMINETWYDGLISRRIDRQSAYIETTGVQKWPKRIKLKSKSIFECDISISPGWILSSALIHLLYLSKLILLSNIVLGRRRINCLSYCYLVLMSFINNNRDATGTNELPNVVQSECKTKFSDKVMTYQRHQLFWLM